ncbi:hypothetical protein [Streptomyces sp. NPDC005231]|uniref:hypothetical protein n=1 Tax=Streptomyces sp. NPDC005231 TaxID=3157026 RepID=UPI0033A6759C
MGIRELFGDLVREPVPLGSVLVALKDLGGIAQLFGDLPQDRGLLLWGGRGVRGLRGASKAAGSGSSCVGRP